MLKKSFITKNSRSRTINVKVALVAGSLQNKCSRNNQLHWFIIVSEMLWRIIFNFFLFCCHYFRITSAYLIAGIILLNNAKITNLQLWQQNMKNLAATNLYFSHNAIFMSSLQISICTNYHFIYLQIICTI